MSRRILLVVVLALTSLWVGDYLGILSKPASNVVLSPSEFQTNRENDERQSTNSQTPTTLVEVITKKVTQTSKLARATFRHFPDLAILSHRTMMHVPPLKHLAELRAGKTEERTGAALMQRTYRGLYGWRFKEYIPSPSEAALMELLHQNTAEGQLEPLVAVGKESAEAYLKLNAQRPAVAPDPQCDGADAAPLPHDVLTSCRVTQDWSAGSEAISSRFVYTFECLGPPCNPDEVPAGYRIGQQHISYIEPLTVSTSDDSKPIHQPRVDTWALSNLYTRWRESGNASLRKAMFLDIGAWKGEHFAFYLSLGDCFCSPFTEIMMWEPAEQSTKVTWKAVPGHMHPHFYHYNYNPKTDINVWTNPLNHVVSKRRPDDVVMLRLELHSEADMAAFTRTILNEEYLYPFMDEVFLPLSYAHALPEGGEAAVKRVAEGVRVIEALRQRGVRAHAWNSAM